jgi:hypothetical protein
MLEEAGEARAVVFVADRSGPALRRRERCLKLAAIPYTVAVERRPSGTYYKLTVRERDAVAAHLALQMGGCGRTLRLREAPSSGLLHSLREFARTLWEELRLLGACLADMVRRVTPRLLPAPRRT